ncbi:hypothetical protein VNO77_19345 [Canavalia gladiata]|uniref:Uncharacterized protein n=1 Tax=Canavalia gladiata TaxID=3824 RepID=A0AAN9LMK7_CANGL
MKEISIRIEDFWETTYDGRYKIDIVSDSGANSITNLANIDVEILVANAGNRGTHIKVSISEDWNKDSANGGDNDDKKWSRLDSARMIIIPRHSLTMVELVSSLVL